MRIGIVGSEGAKFTASGEAQAREIIRWLLNAPDAIVVSGGCHLGGIDIWAEEIADELGREKEIYLPETHNWNGYKARNIQIAVRSDEVHCITVDQLTQRFKGLRHSHCYHCKTDNHIKSGGCWTMKRAKRGYLHIVHNDS